MIQIRYIEHSKTNSEVPNRDNKESEVRSIIYRTRFQIHRNFQSCYAFV